MNKRRLLNGFKMSIALAQIKAISLICKGQTDLQQKGTSLF